MSTFEGEVARLRFGQARVARLATADGMGRPHVVPTVFAVSGDHIYTAVDGKPKTTTALRRLRNVAVNPLVSLLVDHYAENWDELWWVRADGTARILRPDDRESDRGIALLAQRYQQYQDIPVRGPVLAVQVVRWSGWSAIGLFGHG